VPVSCKKEQGQGNKTGKNEVFTGTPLSRRFFSIDEPDGRFNRRPVARAGAVAVKKVD
jgi:hypothetical protein